MITKTCEQIHAETIEWARNKIVATGRVPRICIVKVGNDPASNAYVRGKMNDMDACGISYELRVFSENVTCEHFEEALWRICHNNKSGAFTGVIVQLPLPERLRSCNLKAIIPNTRDIDGFNPQSEYAPCTPLGIMKFLSENKIALTGKNVVIINRSEIVGKPLARMMINANATVTVCNSHTPREVLEDICWKSDIVVVGVGKPNFFDNTMVHTNMLVVDVGINRNKQGKLCGDCTPNLLCEYQTPVPKGVGLLTRAAFIANCLQSVELV